MGKVYAKLFGKKSVKIIIMGLDAAGKTTSLYQMKLGEVVTTIPTIGFNVETFEHENLNIKMWDVGGRDKMRPLMRHYFPGCDAIVFIVDSKDKERIDKASDVLNSFLAENDLRDIPLLVLANKQDCDNIMSPEFITERLGLHKLRQRQWHIQATCATSGQGLHEGFAWLTDMLCYKKARETYESVQASATKGITDNKTITTGWSYAVCGLDRMRNWLWGNSKPMLQAASGSS